jgi:hypothetical protein
VIYRFIYQEITTIRGANLALTVDLANLALTFDRRFSSTGRGDDLVPAGLSPVVQIQVFDLDPTGVG